MCGRPIHSNRLYKHTHSPSFHLQFTHRSLRLVHTHTQRSCPMLSLLCIVQIGARRLCRVYTRHRSQHIKGDSGLVVRRHTAPVEHHFTRAQQFVVGDRARLHRHVKHRGVREREMVRKPNGLQGEITDSTLTSCCSFSTRASRPPGRPTIATVMGIPSSFLLRTLTVI